MDANDMQECLEDFMEENFFVIIEDNSAREVPLN
jgi:hypothetical protein